MKTLKEINQSPREILPAGSDEPKEFHLVELMARGEVMTVLGPAERNALRIVLNTARYKELKQEKQV